MISPREHPETPAAPERHAEARTDAKAQADGDWRLEQLIERLPPRTRASVRWLRRPSSIYVRVPAGTLLTAGGCLGFLPILGFWMLPAGLMLLADDVPPLRSVRSRVLDWIERRRPQWLGEAHQQR